MSLLLSAKKLTKNIGSRDLFSDLSFGVFENEKIGLIGPNGSGKSSLLKLISGEDKPTEGEITSRSGLKLSFVDQEPVFDDTMLVFDFLTKFIIKTSSMDDVDSEVAASIALSQCGFEDFYQPISELSGGWRKRLAIAKALSTEPELLILDEPTNHMDWDGILWLEDMLKSHRASLIVVSHDRSFLNSVSNRVIEINPQFEKGYLSFNCGYYEFLDRKEEYVQAQIKLRDSLSNTARRELDWLRAGVKARTTKSRSRINKAVNLIDQVGEMKSRSQMGSKKSRLGIEHAGIQAKKMIACKDLDIFYDDKTLIKELNLELGAGTCLGLLGENGSGKTSLLRSFTGDNKSFRGDLFVREDLQIIYFDQKRNQLDRNQSLGEYLGDGSDHIVFQDKSTHVASYASRFLFDASKMHLKIKQLSGGEQARLMIAKLLLRPADVLILDEPTNDLDIATIEILEESLESFPGLVIVVSHDRQFLASLAHRFLALEGDGRHQFFADVDQWLKERGLVKEPPVKVKKKKNKPKGSKPKLSFKEQNDLASIEADVLSKEAELETLKVKLEEPDLGKDFEAFQEITTSVSKLQAEIDEMYDYWSKLDKKKLEAQSAKDV